MILRVNVLRMVPILGIIVLAGIYIWYSETRIKNMERQLSILEKPTALNVYDSNGKIAVAISPVGIWLNDSETGRAKVVIGADGGTGHITLDGKSESFTEFSGGSMPFVIGNGEPTK